MEINLKAPELVEGPTNKKLDLNETVLRQAQGPASLLDKKVVTLSAGTAAVHLALIACQAVCLGRGC